MFDLDVISDYEVLEIMEILNPRANGYRKIEGLPEANKVIKEIQKRQPQINEVAKRREILREHIKKIK